MIQEFVCPNGRMSVNGVCPIFEGDDGQIKDIKKKSTYDALREDEIFGEKDSVFEFDFEKPTESAFKSAGNIIDNNLSAYNNFVEEKLGIPAKTQNLFSTALMFATGNPLPFISQFVAGDALKRQDEKIKQRNLNIEAGIIASDNDDNIGFNNPDGSGGYTGGFSSSTQNYYDPYSPGDTE
jgi:hypothetical protein